MKWVAGALVVLAISIVVAAVIIARAQKPIVVHMDGALTTCTTHSFGYADTCATPNP